MKKRGKKFNISNLKINQRAKKVSDNKRVFELRNTTLMKLDDEFKESNMNGEFNVNQWNKFLNSKVS